MSKMKKNTFTEDQAKGLSKIVQENLEKDGKNTSPNNLIERKQIEGTPFTMIKQVMDNDKDKYFIVMGDHRLTEPTTDEDQQLLKLLTEKWKIIVNLIAIVTDKMMAIKRNKIIDESIEARSQGYELSEEFKQHAKNNGVNL